MKLVPLLLLLALSPAFADAPLSVEARAKRIEGHLMAPCCGATTLAAHDSAPA